MKTYQIYECEICGKQSKNADEIIKCECTHLGLTVEENREWEHLKNVVKHCSYVVSKMKKEESERSYDEAIEALLKFEKEHGLGKSLLKKIRQTM